MSEPRNGEKRFISIIGNIVLKWGVGIAALVAAYGAMWVKTNAPSRAQFEALTLQVQGLREEMIRVGVRDEKIGQLETKLEKYDDRLLELERRATPRRLIP
jgi:hypothetical protein